MAGALAAALGLALLAPAPRALPPPFHLPHDNAKDVVLSPAFVQDGTVFAVVQLTTHLQVLRSRDGGSSWDVLGAPFVNHGINALEPSPDFAADQTLFAATEKAGLWRSLDAGDTWESWGSEGSGLPEEPIKALSASPDFGSDGTLLAGTLVGLYRSTDGGATWAPMTAGILDTIVAQVDFAPDDAMLAFAAGNSVHRSQDGGQTWVPLQTFSLPVQTLALSPGVAADGVLAVGFGRFGGGVMTSDDGGASWSAANAGLQELTVNDLALAPDGTAFAVTMLQACYRAPSLGAPWTLHTQGYEENTEQTSNHHIAIAVSPGFAADGEVYVASFEGLHSSVDGGLGWGQRDTHNQRLNLNIALTPDAGELFAANYGGGVLRLGLDAGASAPVELGGAAIAAGTWLQGPVLQAPGPQPAAGPPAGVPATGWSSRAWELTDLYAGELAVSPAYASDRTVYYGLLGLARSTDGGRLWQSLPVPAPFPRTLALVDDFAEHPTLLYGTYELGTWISHDGGDSWGPASGGLPASIKVSAIALSPDFSADGRAFLSSVTHGVWRTLDGGASWQTVGTELGTSIVRSVGVSPDFGADGVVLAGTGGAGLWRSADGGATWAAASVGMPSGAHGVVEELAFSPDFASDGVVFAASNGDGVLRSDDGGQSWSPASAGMSPSAPRDLVLSAQFGTDGTLFASTYDWIWRSTDGGQAWTRLPGFLHVDETHPTVLASGTWSRHALGNSHGGGTLASDTPGDALAFRFHGRSVACFFLRDPASGVVDIELDGRLAARVDLHAAAVLQSDAVWSQTFAGPGWHDVRVVVTGLASAQATGAFVRSDGFQYTF